MVYQLLRTVKEVNNADIKTAVNRIVNGNRQAVLITDGEFFTQGITGDNLNNPYLSESFRTWMKKVMIFIYTVNLMWNLANSISLDIICYLLIKV